MKMRQQFPLSVLETMDNDDKVVVLLGDIGVWSFHKAKEKYPERVYNIGILEQATISLAAGMSKVGLIPVVHTIAPFLVERAYEQIKVDFGYQNIGGNFISVGASNDYSGLGYTHYCPADVNVLSNIPNMQIVLPGTDEEFDLLFKTGYNNGKPTYYRICEEMNSKSQKVILGKANVVKKGNLATVIAVGPMLEKVLNAVGDLDVTILYYTTIRPFDCETLVNNLSGNKIIAVEPYFSGAISNAIANIQTDINLPVYNIGIPMKVLKTYGTIEDINKDLELTPDCIFKRIQKIIGL